MKKKASVFCLLRLDLNSSKSTRFDKNSICYDNKQSSRPNLGESKVVFTLTGI